MAIYNPMIRAQENLARTIQGGLSEWGNRPLERAKISLQEAALLDSIRRNKIADELAQNQDTRAAQSLAHTIAIGEAANERAQTVFDAGATARELGQVQSQEELGRIKKQQELRNLPITMETLVPIMFKETGSPETFMDFAANRKLQKIMDATGGKFENGRFIKKNGQVATWNDIDNILAIAKPIIRSDVDPGHLLDQKVREAEDFMNQGGVLNPKTEAWLSQAKKWQKDPQWLIDQYNKLNDHDYQMIEEFKKRGLSTGTFETNIARRNRKIEKQQGVLSKKADRAFEIEKLTMQEAGKDRRAAAKEAGDIPKSQRQLINDAMRNLGNNLGFGDDWTNLDKKDQEVHGYYMNLTGRLAKFDPKRYKGDPATLAGDVKQLVDWAQQYADEMVGEAPGEDSKEYNKYLDDRGMYIDQFIEKTLKGEDPRKPTVPDWRMYRGDE